MQALVPFLLPSPFKDSGYILTSNRYLKHNNTYPLNVLHKQTRQDVYRLRDCTDGIARYTRADHQSTGSSPS